MHVIVETETPSTKVKDLITKLSIKHGSYEHLYQRVQISRCSDPTLVDDLMVWKTLMSGSIRYTELFYYKDSKIIGILTPKRMELLELLRKEGRPLNLTKISKMSRRNYKNVYDDINGLEPTGLITKAKKGREVLVTTNVKRMTILFDDSDIHY